MRTRWTKKIRYKLNEFAIYNKNQLIHQIIIIALLVLSIHYTMQPDEIFGKLGDWLEDHLSDAIHPAVFSCNVCMAPHYGSVLYWLIPWHHELWQWLVVVIGAMGVNVVINKWAPEKEDKKDNEMIHENILQAYGKIKGISPLQSRFSHTEDWRILFRYYNENNAKHLGMSCMPCYSKVLVFIETKVKQLIGEKAETKEDAEAKKG